MVDNSSEVVKGVITGREYTVRRLKWGEVLEIEDEATVLVPAKFPGEPPSVKLNTAKWIILRMQRAVKPDLTMDELRDMEPLEAKQLNAVVERMNTLDVKAFLERSGATRSETPT